MLAATAVCPRNGRCNPAGASAVRLAVIIPRQENHWIWSAPATELSSVEISTKTHAFRWSCELLRSQQRSFPCRHGAPSQGSAERTSRRTRISAAQESVVQGSKSGADGSISPRVGASSPAKQFPNAVQTFSARRQSLRTFHRRNNVYRSCSWSHRARKEREACRR